MSSSFGCECYLAGYLREDKKSYERVLSAGAGRRIRTPDLLITNQPLYLLSYAGA